MQEVYILFVEVDNQPKVSNGIGGVFATKDAAYKFMMRHSPQAYETYNGRMEQHYRDPDGMDYRITYQYVQQ